jgi:hypothetical protein
VSRTVAIALLVAAAVLGLAACTVDRNKYAQAVYACDIKDENVADECGAGWTCYAGHQIGTSDFCAPTCTASDAEHYCTAAGAELAACDPSGSAYTCASGLECVRMNVVEDAGLCLPMEVCSEDADCRDPVRQKCLAGAVSQAYGGAVKTNNLWCLQHGCSDLSPCEAGYSCMTSTLLPTKAPNICVPNCGHDDLCPRSFVCASKVFPSLPYRFCLLGLFAFPCRSDDECLVGSCRDIGHGGKACTVTCATDADCGPFSSAGFPARCNGGQCTSPTSLLMPYLCDTLYPGSCPTGTECSATPAAGSTSTTGICTKTCATAADCAGVTAVPIPLGCYQPPGGTKMCYPGFAGIECAGDASCLEGLQCLTLPGGLGDRCAAHCTTDGDCARNRWMSDSWRCRLGVCSPL